VTRPTLHLLGCGRAARVFARWLLEAGQVEIGQVCNRSLESSADAVAFMGAGEAVAEMNERITGGWLLLGLPDGELAAMALGLSCRMPGQPELCFHLSGSMPGDMLAPLGAPTASVHPARAFARPDQALAGMPGTWLVAEGDRGALDRLGPAIKAAEGRWLEIDSAGKRLYHAATVAASNYLVTLVDLARELAQAAGLDADTGASLLAHLQRGTLDNLDGQSARAALTGPIERADASAVTSLLAAVEKLSPEQAQLFRALGLATLELAIAKRGSKPGDEAIRQSLTSRSG
jgi:predicted short-subunit dehydrogenase-like oxidoreductase (DUF2520 family)